MSAADGAGSGWCSGGPGGRKGTQAGRNREAVRPAAHLEPASCCARPSGRVAARPRVAAIVERGELVPDALSAR